MPTSTEEAKVSCARGVWEAGGSCQQGVQATQGGAGEGLQSCNCQAAGPRGCEKRREQLLLMLSSWIRTVKQGLLKGLGPPGPVNPLQPSDSWVSRAEVLEG